MTLWKAEPDPHNANQWRIINDTTGKTVVSGLSQADADAFVRRRNWQEARRKDSPQKTT